MEIQSQGEEGVMKKMGEGLGESNKSSPVLEEVLGELDDVEVELDIPLDSFESPKDEPRQPHDDEIMGCEKKEEERNDYVVVNHPLQDGDFFFDKQDDTIDTIASEPQGTTPPSSSSFPLSCSSPSPALSSSSSEDPPTLSSLARSFAPFSKREKHSTDKSMTGGYERRKEGHNRTSSVQVESSSSMNNHNQETPPDSSLSDNFRQLSTIFGLSLEGTPPTSPLDLSPPSPNTTKSSVITTPTPSTPSTNDSLLARRSLGSAKMLFGEPEEGEEVEGRPNQIERPRNHSLRHSQPPSMDLHLQLRVGTGLTSNGPLTPPVHRQRKTMPPTKDVLVDEMSIKPTKASFSGPEIMKIDQFLKNQIGKVLDEKDVELVINNHIHMILRLPIHPICLVAEHHLKLICEKALEAKKSMVEIMERGDNDYSGATYLEPDSDSDDDIYFGERGSEDEQEGEGTRKSEEKAESEEEEIEEKQENKQPGSDRPSPPPRAQLPPSLLLPSSHNSPTNIATIPTLLTPTSTTPTTDTTDNTTNNKALNRRASEQTVALHEEVKQKTPLCLPHRSPRKPRSRSRSCQPFRYPSTTASPSPPSTPPPSSPPDYSAIDQFLAPAPLPSTTTSSTSISPPRSPSSSPSSSSPFKKEDRSGTILEEIVFHTLRKKREEDEKNSTKYHNTKSSSLTNFPHFGDLRASGGPSPSLSSSSPPSSPPSSPNFLTKGDEKGGGKGEIGEKGKEGVEGEEEKEEKGPRTGYGLRTDLEVGEEADKWNEVRNCVVSALTQIQLCVFRHYPFLRRKQARVEATGQAILEFVFEKSSPEVMGFYNTRWKGADDHLSEMWEKFETACGGVTPANLGLPKQLWLYDPWSDVTPYSASIIRLRKIDKVHTAKDKLVCLVDVGNLIFKDLEKYWEPNEFSKLSVMVGGDELLPLFMYVIIKARVKKAFSQSYFMQDFIDDQCSIQKEGYLLATFQTAVALLANETDPKDMAERGEEAKRRQRITKQERKPPPLDDDDLQEI